MLFVHRRRPRAVEVEAHCSRCRSFKRTASDQRIFRSWQHVSGGGVEALFDPSN